MRAFAGQAAAVQRTFRLAAVRPEQGPYRDRDTSKTNHEQQRAQIDQAEDDSENTQREAPSWHHLSSDLPGTPITGISAGTVRDMTLVCRKIG
jgi:hypothetical protein